MKTQREKKKKRWTSSFDECDKKERGRTGTRFKICSLLFGILTIWNSLHVFLLLLPIEIAIRGDFMAMTKNEQINEAKKSLLTFL